MWIFRKTLSVGNFYIPGWSSVFPEPSFINDGSHIYCRITFHSAESNKGLLTWDVVPKIPWELFYFGGGLL
jgi:sodium-dependent dicarboxylate transporter 2/3/5